ncbi:peptidase inhibitor family I36 protein [Kitasatospora sp. NPDC088351]|uniref:peptidase inhibitor family I36 protein n=1 Tax=Kitasatospora sp. NPDC088351 TaxID=3155180 RepID=UPI00341CD605
MVRISRVGRVVSGMAVAATLSGLFPASAEATATGYPDCASGLFCAWTGDNGTGSRCEWRVDDADWSNGQIVCGWAAGTRVRSVYNHGESGAPVSAYTATDWGGTKVFCLAKDAKLNLSGAGTYLRSHKWEC